MNKKELIAIYQVLSGLKLNKFSDTELRKNLFKDYLILHNLAKTHDESVGELRKKYFEGFDEDLQKALELDNQMRASRSNTEEFLKLKKERDSYTKIDEIISEFNTAIKNMMDESVEVEIFKVNKDSFITDLSEDLTFAQIAILEPLFE